MVPTAQKCGKTMSDIATNRKARRDYHISEKFEGRYRIERNRGEVDPRREKSTSGIPLSGLIAVRRGFINCDIRPFEQASHEFHITTAESTPLASQEGDSKARRPYRSERRDHRCRCVSTGKTVASKSSLGVGKGKDQRDKREDLKAKSTQSRSRTGNGSITQVIGNQRPEKCLWREPGRKP